MKILSIYAHPRPNSLCSAIAHRANTVLRGLNHEVIFRDLYKEEFDPILKPEEAYTVGDKIEELLRNSSDALVNSHRQSIAEADGLLVVHPNWWGKPPAILSGWLDRVLVPGVAYRLHTAEGEPDGLLSVRRALVLNTSDTPAEREQEILGDPLRLIWENCVLPYCGVQNVERKMFGPVAGSSEQRRKSWLDTVEDLVVKVFSA